MAFHNKNEKHGDRDDASSRLPKIGDFVVYKDGGKKIHFRVIDQIMTGSQDNVVSLRVIKYGKMTHQLCHIRLLKLIYRPTDDLNF